MADRELLDFSHQKKRTGLRSGGRGSTQTFKGIIRAGQPPHAFNLKQRSATTRGLKKGREVRKKSELDHPG